jgi:uncharacterized protein YbaP (TraB family)
VTPSRARAAPTGARLAALLAIALIPPAADARGSGVLWTVEGRHNTVYLLGSVHLLRDSDGALPDAAEAAYADAEQVLMEIDLDDPAVAGPAAMIDGMQRAALLPAGTTLRGVLGPDYDSIARQVEEAGLDLGLLDGFAPWFVATLLMQVELAHRGFRPELGIEQRIAERAARDRKPIEGLETPVEQFTLLARLPLPVQKRFLEMTLEETESMDADLERMLEAWRAGDTAALAELLTDAYEEFPELYGPLTEERNRAWVEDIAALLDEPDDYLVVVGALHLVGRNSVVELLRGRGHRVTQQ